VPRSSNQGLTPLADHDFTALEREAIKEAALTDAAMQEYEALRKAGKIRPLPVPP
jgi:hypothetical protein